LECSLSIPGLEDLGCLSKVWPSEGWHEAGGSFFGTRVEDPIHTLTKLPRRLDPARFTCGRGGPRFNYTEVQEKNISRLIPWPRMFPLSVPTTHYLRLLRCCTSSYVISLEIRSYQSCYTNSLSLSHSVIRGTRVPIRLKKLKDKRLPRPVRRRPKSAAHRVALLQLSRWTVSRYRGCARARSSSAGAGRNSEFPRYRIKWRQARRLITPPPLQHPLLFHDFKTLRNKWRRRLQRAFHPRLSLKPQRILSLG